jgi:hypothetical protein
MTDDVKVGSYWFHRHGEVRVMAIAEGYAMVRRRGCAPFVVSCKELIAQQCPKCPRCGVFAKADAQRDAAPAGTKPCE